MLRTWSWGRADPRTVILLSNGKGWSKRDRGERQADRQNEKGESEKHVEVEIGKDTEIGRERDRKVREGQRDGKGGF